MKPSPNAADGHVVASPPSQGVDLQGIDPIDWEGFWAADRASTEWLVEPLIPTGRQVALHAKAKAGKSLLGLEIAVCLATGRAILDRPAGPRVPVVYADYEMTEDDLRERLESFGYGPADDLSLLAYYQLPSLHPLDSAAGGAELAELARRNDAALVVIDTMARAVKGEENSADTMRDFFRFTGAELKREGRALLRLDHQGKDSRKGQRGSSSKNDDVDVIWAMSANNDQIKLRSTSRVSWVPKEVILDRIVEDGRTEHVLHESSQIDEKAQHIVEVLDGMGIPLGMSNRDAAETLRASGWKGRTSDLASAIKFRRQRGNVATRPGNGRRVVNGNAESSPRQDSFDRGGNTPGNAGQQISEQPGNPVPPQRGDRCPAPNKDDDHRCPLMRKAPQRLVQVQVLSRPRSRKAKPEGSLV